MIQFSWVFSISYSSRFLHFNAPFHLYVLQPVQRSFKTTKLTGSHAGRYGPQDETTLVVVPARVLIQVLLIVGIVQSVARLHSMPCLLEHSTRSAMRYPVFGLSPLRSKHGAYTRRTLVHRLRGTCIRRNVVVEGGLLSCANVRRVVVVFMRAGASTSRRHGDVPRPHRCR